MSDGRVIDWTLQRPAFDRHYGVLFGDRLELAWFWYREARTEQGDWNEPGAFDPEVDDRSDTDAFLALLQEATGSLSDEEAVAWVEARLPVFVGEVTETAGLFDLVAERRFTSPVVATLRRGLVAEIDGIGDPGTPTG